MTEDRFKELRNALEKLDNDENGKGSWTYRVLNLIRNNPKIDLSELSQITGNNQNELLDYILELYDLGLILGHEIGYSLSPNGKEFLKKLSET